MCLLTLLALVMVVVCLPSCGGNDDDDYGGGESKDLWLPVKGKTFKEKDSDEITYWHFGDDGTATRYLYNTEAWNSDDGIYKLQSVVSFQYSESSEYPGTYTYTSDSGKKILFTLSNSGITGRTDLPYSLSFGDYFGEGSKWNSHHGTIEYSKPAGYDAIYEDGSPYYGSSGGGTDSGTGSGSSTEEWVKVRATGYQPYWYCPTDGPSTKYTNNDIRAYKNTRTGAYKVKYGYKEYTATKGYNKITIDEMYHSVYNSKYGYWSSCRDCNYFEFTIWE